MKSSHRRFQPRVMAIALLAPHAPLLAGLSTLSELARHAQTDLRLGALELRRRQRRRHVVATIRDGRILKYLIRHGKPDVRTHAIGSAKASRGIHVAELRLRGSKALRRGETVQTHGPRTILRPAPSAFHHRPQLMLRGSKPTSRRLLGEPPSLLEIHTHAVAIHVSGSQHAQRSRIVPIGSELQPANGLGGVLLDPASSRIGLRE